MKKIILLGILSLIGLQMMACDKKGVETIDVSNDSVQAEIVKAGEVTIESFSEKVNGFWGGKVEDQWEIINFENDKFNHYIYEGMSLVCDGKIEKVMSHYDETVDIVISYNNEETLETTEYNFKTTDDFRRTLIHKYYATEYDYVYLGRTQEEAHSYIDREQSQEIKDEPLESDFYGESAHQQKNERDNLPEHLKSDLNLLEGYGFKVYEQNGVWKCDIKCGTITYSTNTWIDANSQFRTEPHWEGWVSGMIGGKLILSTKIYSTDLINFSDYSDNKFILNREGLN